MPFHILYHLHSFLYFIFHRSKERFMERLNCTGRLLFQSLVGVYIVMLASFKFFLCHLYMACYLRQGEEYSKTGVTLTSVLADWQAGNHPPASASLMLEIQESDTSLITILCCLTCGPIMFFNKISDTGQGLL